MIPFREITKKKREKKCCLEGLYIKGNTNAKARKSWSHAVRGQFYSDFNLLNRHFIQIIVAVIGPSEFAYVSFS